ncbi:phosphonate transport system permease protein [Chromohalobacter marismortui]|uniref:Phosphonate transport system permease protein n=1 Tax=Chromohalobacter marismortui TaxID=42055 RepID=A0A4R7NPG7_9GAMM|nr:MULTISPECIES: phosphonate ABC transporter, permease protein PhnE [Chromohalobacter]MCI0509540.1 phosphonate ABC transporter, permease protein PhnE [Chromohalobacter sp.]MCI0592566.1 phosphonate ABC transporter, permease protein PhnE [Chromohalobacter sp.]TDU22260.1 phosphonate transport system permease protein [Chromohalobacter marismortui]
MATTISDEMQVRAGRRSWKKPLCWAVALLVLSWAWQGAGIAPGLLLDNFDNMVVLAGDFVPPTFGNLMRYVQEMLVTIQIAIWGTLLAVICAVPFGLFSASNIAPWWINQPVRRLMDACRAINELVFAMLFVVAVGLGPFAGTLALFVHTTGVLAKLFSEAVEAADAGPMEGIRVTGAGRLEEIAFGLIPQVLPLWLSVSLYRFESNIRSATVLGMVGGGGIGVSLWQTLRGFDYAEAATIMLVIIVAVSLLDMLSQQVRKRFI